MPRLPRIEFANAIYHVITRGDGRQKLFHDSGHYDRSTRGVKEEVTRSNWRILAYEADTFLALLSISPPKLAPILFGFRPI